MYKQTYRKTHPRSGNIAKGGVKLLAQVTNKVVGNVRTDTRLEERRLVDGQIVYALMEYTIILDTLNPREPDASEIRVWDYKEFAQIIDMCGQVLDIMESGDRRKLPINLTIDAKGEQDGTYAQ